VKQGAAMLMFWKLGLLPDRKEEEEVPKPAVRRRSGERRRRMDD
jgi:hypothetical protein